MTKSDKKKEDPIKKEESVEEKLKTIEEKLLRTLAEMENQRRRFEKERKLSNLVDLILLEKHYLY